MSWGKRVKTFQEKRSIVHPIKDLGDIRFYPNRMGQLQQLRSVSENVTSSMAVLFSDTSGDADGTTETRTDGNGFEMQTSTASAVSTDVLAYRAKERKEAISRIFEVADRRNLMLIGEMLMDSMREEFKYSRSRGPQEVEEFLFGTQGSPSSEDAEAIEEGEGAIDVCLFTELMQGWIKANSKVFGSMGEKLAGLVKGRLQSVSGLELDPAKTTSGDTSKNPSSQLSLVDGASSE